MKSPFPGMDPYLEQHWGDVHHRLIAYACDMLEEGLPNDLRARVQERVFVESPSGIERAIYPDVHVVERAAEPLISKTEGSVSVAEPVVIHVEDEPVTQGFIEIIDSGSGSRVITVIEFLSPSNKVPGEGMELYLKKQKELIDAAVSLVEIDLLRTGQWVLAVPYWHIPPSHRTTYQICVRRGWRPRAFEVYRVPLQEKLPAIKIPLRETDEDAVLDIQALIEECYRKGRYDDFDYTRSPEPPLDASDAAWVDDLLKACGRG